MEVGHGATVLGADGGATGGVGAPPLPRPTAVPARVRRRALAGGRWAARLPGGAHRLAHTPSPRHGLSLGAPVRAGWTGRVDPQTARPPRLFPRWTNGRCGTPCTRRRRCSASPARAGGAMTWGACGRVWPTPAWRG